MTDGTADHVGADLPQGVAESVLDGLQDNIAVLDDEGVIVHTNEPWRSFGEANDLTEADSIGVDYLAVCDEADDEYANRAADGIRSVIAGESSTFELEYPCHSPDERRWFLMRVSPLDLGGERYVLVVHTDITERKLAELRVVDRAEDIKARNESLALMNRIVRHDIRNDMEAVLGRVEYLERQVDHEDKQYLTDVRRIASEVVDLTGAIGRVADAIVEGAEPDLEPVDPVEVVRSQIEMARQAHERGHTDPTFVGPEDPPEVRVLSDDLLSAVLSNLIDNAVFHSDVDSPRIEVDVGADDEWVRITVADDGLGIPDDRKEAVFDRGELGADSEGTGLGMYLVDRLVDLYGGEVYVEDSHLGGAAVVVELHRAD